MVNVYEELLTVWSVLQHATVVSCAHSPTRMRCQLWLLHDLRGEALTNWDDAVETSEDTGAVAVAAADSFSIAAGGVTDGS